MKAWPSARLRAQAVHASAEATAAASPVASLNPQEHSSSLPANVAFVGLSRDNAVTALQILLEGAGRAGERAGGAAGALAALAGCLAVSHSPAAAERQACAVFEGGALGPGGAALLQLA
jgi:hypothetical protein